ncbi:transporter substrate-binding domain-containing protein [Aureimonas fodinaquatilis]|uniref:Transporter substrate-binding domain-containing protein n=1 Tax=Aureimonas fodinaquatilis TaxID=2565783 RepID=A0A5B0DTA6_9HYPH|nr:transporter substrate-binding domain-containing protein [Aureimonas fodinaquatilis]KAA0969648.1 transporter substrate-binding domain-containing protein [Aureimonas fodinaquatilis]
MNKTITSLALAGFFVTVAPGALHAEVLDDIRSRGSITCGVLNNLEPFGYLDPATREVIGYEVDLCRALAEHLGVTAEIKVVSSQARMPELLQGRLDVIVALISYSPERAEQIDFSGTYVADSFQAITTEGSGLETLDDIAGKRVSVIKGSFLEPLIQSKYPTATTVSFDDAATTFMAVAQGRVDATVQRTTQARALQLRLGDADNTVMLDPPITVQRSGFAIRKENPAFLAELNTFLAEYEESGAAQTLFDRWLGSESPFQLTRTFVVGSDIAE